MRWVIACTLCAYALVNAPVIYALCFTHGPAGIARLWGFAPNQFLFLSTVFPIGAFASLTALYLMVTRLGPTLPSDSLIRWFACQNWAALLLVGTLLASIVGLIVYYGSSLSFDKLKPPYAIRAAQSLHQIRAQIQTSKPADREEFITALTSRAKIAAKAIPVLNHPSDSELTAQLDSLPPEVFLQVVVDPSRQMRLGVLDPAIRALNVLQLLVALLIAFCGIATGVVCLLVVLRTAAPAHSWQVGQILTAVYVAAVSFAAYPLCYLQHRREVEAVTGLTTSVYQDVISGGLIVVCLVVVWLANPSSKVWSLQSWFQGLPILGVASVFVAERTAPEFMARFIGTETTIAIQALLSVVVLIASAVVAAVIWPR